MVWEIFNLNFKNGTYPLQNDSLNTFLLIDSVEQKELSIKNEVQALSKSLGELSKLICSSLASSNSIIFSTPFFPIITGTPA